MSRPDSAKMIEEEAEGAEGLDQVLRVEHAPRGKDGTKHRSTLLVGAGWVQRHVEPLPDQVEDRVAQAPEGLVVAVDQRHGDHAAHRRDAHLAGEAAAVGAHAEQLGHAVDEHLLERGPAAHGVGPAAWTSTRNTRATARSVVVSASM